MHAVMRETFCGLKQPIQDRKEFKDFQSLHSARQGYGGTVVVDTGNGRFLTLTLWQTVADAERARIALGPEIERPLNPLMTAPTNLLGTREVVLDGLSHCRDLGCLSPRESFARDEI